jgi:hypothetical protein
MNSKLEGLIRAFDALIALRDVARPFTDRPPRDQPGESDRAGTTLAQNTAAQAVAGQIENRLTNVVVAALKEAFDRDHARLELERTHLEEERRRADAALRLEARRQAAERELARLRLLAGAALFGWLVSVVLLVVRAATASMVSRGLMGAGWILLLLAVGAAFDAQRRIATFTADSEPAPSAGWSGAAALWLLVAGLAIATIGLVV